MQSMQPQEGAYRPRERSTWHPEEQSYEQPLNQEVELSYSHEGRWNIEERGEKLRPTQQEGQQRRSSGRRSFFPLFIIAIILIAVFSSHYFMKSGADNGFSMARPVMPIRKEFHNSDSKMTEFKVSEQSTLTISGNYNNITIHTNTDSLLSIQSDGINPQIGRNGDNIDLTTDSRFPGTSLDITLPSSMSLNISNQSGNIDIDGSRGNIQADTTLGNISIHHASGQLALNTTTGDITLDTVQLGGHSSLTTKTGHIGFNGTLDAQGTYIMTSTTGDIDVTLPSDTAFNLDSSGSNSINNAFGSNTIGSDPRPSLSIHSDHGAIHINKQ